MSLNIAVLGSGVVGLTTALELQKEFRNASIDLIAEKFGADTTSHVAAGLFRPSPNLPGPDENTTRKWVHDAYTHWDELLGSPDAANAGVMQLSGYLFSSQHEFIVRNSLLEKLLPIYRPATEQELALCPGNWKYGSFFTTVLIECGLYLPWATAKFTRNGGRVFTRKIDKFSDLMSDKYNVVVNCTGLGAKSLCNDPKLVAIRGQVVKVRAPWLKTFFYGDYDTYVIPGFDSVTLGGCRQYDSYNLNVDKYDAASIRERCEALVPSLKNSHVLRNAVGLRPHRDPIRVEKETLGKLKIVHNYGHGGYGVTMAPGTSIDAVRRVRDSLAGNSKL